MLVADALAFVGNLIGGFIQILTLDFEGGFETIKSAFGNFFSGIWDSITNLFGGIWNWLADSKVGKFLGLSKVEMKKTEPAKAEVAPAKTGTAATATTGVDTKALAQKAGATGGGGGGVTNVTDTGSKSIVDAMMKSSAWMQDKMTYMSGNLERVVDRTTKTANSAAASLEQLKVLNTNTLAMKELTRRIEALTRATYEGGGKVVIDGKTLASSVSRYADNTQGTNPNSFTQIFRGETTTYG